MTDGDPVGGPSEPVTQVPDAARAVLSRMRAGSRAAAPAPARAAARATGSSGARPARPRRGRGGYSGPGPDLRDPRPLAAIWAGLVADQGWQAELSGARLTALWPQIMGEQNAAHATPESFDAATGTLLIRTSSTAWADQLRLMLPMLRSTLEAHVGTGVVRDIQVVGPAPPRTRGRLRVRGRGPRDTYG